MAVTFGCLLALEFEITGFGRAWDEPLRGWYVATLIAGAVAGVALPVVVTWRWLQPAGRAAVAGVGLTSAVAMLAMVGVGLW